MIPLPMLWSSEPAEPLRDLLFGIRFCTARESPSSDLCLNRSSETMRILDLTSSEAVLGCCSASIFLC
ncbi:hypothetical protein PTKIN_Ptkin07bG0290200 [Pterospermum kingtungense]